MSKKIVLAALLLLVLGWSPAVWAEGAGLVAQGLELYAQRADLAKAKEAVEVLAKAVEAEPDNAQALEGFSSALYWVGEHLADKKEREAVHARGLEAARKFVESHPQSVVGYYRRGLHQVRILQLTRNTKLIDPVKEDMAKALEIDPAYEGGGPNRVLGRLYFSLPWIMGGSNKKAIDNLTKAVELGPRLYLNQVYLAEVLIKEKKKEEAKKLIETVLSATPEQGQEPDFAEWKGEAGKLKAELD